MRKSFLRNEFENKHFLSLLRLCIRSGPPPRHAHTFFCFFFEGGHIKNLINCNKYNHFKKKQSFIGWAIVFCFMTPPRLPPPPKKKKKMGGEYVGGTSNTQPRQTELSECIVKTFSTKLYYEYIE